MKRRLFLIAAVLALFVSCQRSHAQYEESHSGYASLDAEDPVARSAAWQEPGDDETAGDGSLLDSNYDCGEGCGCEGLCDSCGEGCPGVACGCTCAPSWQFFGDFLCLRPRNAEVVYGVPFNGPVTSPPDVPIQIGGLGLTDYDYEPAFRVGYTGALNDCASLGVTYTQFDSSTSDSISTAAPYVIRSMVSHPSTLSASSDGLDASAAAGIDFDLVDLDFRGAILCGDRHTVNYLLGVRYAYLEQGFFSRYAVNGVETVATDVFFDGGGIRLGLEAERYIYSNSRFMVYGRGFASFVAGEFEARYVQDNAFSADHVVDARFKFGRLMSILDLEVGVGWTSYSGRWRMAGGYLFSAWYNAVKTDDFIQAVRSNTFVGLGDKLTFDGLTARIEYRF